MQVKQHFSLLIFPKRENKEQEWATLYARVTIDGLDNEFSLSIKIRYLYWLKDTKSVDEGHPKAKQINAKIRAAEIDLERHFLLVQAKNGIALPEAVRESYQTPINGKDLIKQKEHYTSFQSTLVDLLWDYVRFCEKRRKILDQQAVLSLAKEIELVEQLKCLDKRIKEIAKDAFGIFDDKQREKTLVMAIDEYLFNFLTQVHTKNKAYTTLEKWLGRRQRYIDFLQYRFRKNDIPLSALEYAFMDDLTNYCKLIHEVIENTAMNYAKHLKSVMKRVVSRGWILYNVFAPFKCPYIDPPSSYLTKEQFFELKNYWFEEKDRSLNVIRDLYLFACFTGLSYSELYRLSPRHIKKQSEGEYWIDLNRQKTDEQEKKLMFPLAVEIMKKYKDHPLCLKKGRILPMPTNEHWNRSLKKIGGILKFDLKMDGHDTRYFFINVVALNNGIPIEDIKDMVGHADVKSTRHYTRDNKSQVAKSMQLLKNKLFDANGKLIEPAASIETDNSTYSNGLKVVHLNR